MPQSDIALFLNALLGDFTKPTAYGCYHHDSRNEVKRPKAFFSDNLLHIEDTLDQLNCDGYNVYYYFNEMDGNGIKRQNVTRTRGFFIDFDDIMAPAKPPLQESFHIGRDNNPERSQMIWLINDECPLHVWETLMHQLANRYGGDSAVCRLETAARLVGYNAGNPLYDAEYVIYSHNEKTYTTEEFIKAFELDPDLPLPKQTEQIIEQVDEAKKVPLGQRNAALCTLASRLRMYYGGQNGIIASLKEFRDNYMEVGDDPVPDKEVEHIAKWAMSFTPEHQVNVADLINFEKLVSNPDMPTFTNLSNDTTNPKPSFPKKILEQTQGTMKILMDHMNENSFRLQPNLSYGSALVAMSGIIAKAIQWNHTCSSIIVVGMAPTGHGKDVGIQMPCRILNMVSQARRLVGANDFASDVGFIAQIDSKRSVLFFIDEFGDKIQKTKQNNSHTHHLPSRIKEMYSKCGQGGRFQTAYRDNEKNFNIENFTFSLYGTGVQDAIFDNLTTSDIRGGLTARLMLIEGEENMPPFKLPPNTKPPEELLTDIMFWSAQNLDKPVNISMSAEALSLYTTFGIEMDGIISGSNEIMASFFTRCMQNAAKVALIHAASRSQEPEIEACDMEIAMQLTRYSAELGAWHALNSVADTRVGRDNNLILRMIYQAGRNGLTTSKLTQLTRNHLDKRTRVTCLDELIDSGDVIQQNLHNGKPGKNPTVFIATAHLKGQTNG